MSSGWARLVSSLSSVPVSREDEEQLQRSLDQVLTSDAMREVVREVALGDEEEAGRGLFFLFNAYRKIPKLFQNAPEMMKDAYFPNPYLKLVADSVLHALASADEGKRVGKLMDVVSVEARRAMAYSLFCSQLDGYKVDIVINSLSQSTQLEIMTLVLHSSSSLLNAVRKMYGYESDASISNATTSFESQNEGNLPSSPPLETLRHLMIALMYGHSNSDLLQPMDIADRLFLRGNALPGSVIRVLVRCFHRSSNDNKTEIDEKADFSRDDDLLNFAELVVGGVWAEPAFVSRGNSAVQASITYTLLETLRRIHDDLEKRQNIEDGTFPVALMGGLARGISLYIDSPAHMTRLHGMRVAVEFSRLMVLRSQLTLQRSGSVTDQPLRGREVIVFDELEQYEEDDEGLLVLKKTASSEIFPHESDVNRDDGTDNCDSDSDSSESEDLESYFLDELDGRMVPSASHGISGDSGEGSEDLIPVYYLRQALSLLQFTDSSSPNGTYLNHKSVLFALPRLIYSRPADGHDLAGPLLRELLRLGNNFNMQNFAERRRECMVALIYNYPDRAVDILVWAAGSDTLAMGVRLEALTAMVEGARLLSGAHISSRPDTSSSAMAVKEVEESSRGSGANTIVKRPRRLAAMRKEMQRISRENPFGDYALKFFQPLHAILMEQLRKLESLGNSYAAEGLEVLLPSQCLICLGAFVRCAINTIHQRSMLEGVLAVAFPLGDHSSLHLRRASVGCLYDCIDCLFHSLSSSDKPRSASHQDQFGTLGFLMNISPQFIFDDDGSISHSNKSSLTFTSLPSTTRDLVALIIQWVASTVKVEEDTHCKVLKAEIVSLSLKFFKE